MNNYRIRARSGHRQALNPTRRRGALVAVTVAAVLLPADAATSGAATRVREPIPEHGTLFVTERSSATPTVSALDAGTGDVLWTAPSGGGPIGVTHPAGTGRVYSSDEKANQVSVYEARTGARLAQIPVGPKPHHLMASRNGEFVYVAEFGRNTVGVVSTTTQRVVAHFAASQSAAARTHAVWISGDGKDLYAANTVVDTVSKIDAASGALRWELPVGKTPSEILVAADSRRAYVSLRGEDAIRVLDVSGTRPRAVGDVPAVSEPDTLSLTNDGRTLVVGLRAAPKGAARAALVDTRRLRTRYVELPGHASTGHQWLSADGQRTYMAVEKPGGVAVINNRTATLVDVHAVSGPVPHGVFFAPSTLS